MLYFYDLHFPEVLCHLRKDNRYCTGSLKIVLCTMSSTYGPLKAQYYRLMLQQALGKHISKHIMKRSCQYYISLDSYLQ